MKIQVFKNNEKKKSKEFIKQTKEKEAVLYNLDHQINTKEDFIDKKNKKLLPSLYAKKDKLNDKTTEIKTVNGDITIGFNKEEKKATIAFTKKQNKYIDATNSRDKEIIDNSSSIYRQHTDNVLVQGDNEATGIKYEKNKNYKRLKENISRIKKANGDISLTTMDIVCPEINNKEFSAKDTYYSHKLKNREIYIEKKVNKAMDKIKIELNDASLDDFPELIKKRLLDSIKELGDNDNEDSEDD